MSYYIDLPPEDDVLPEVDDPRMVLVRWRPTFVLHRDGLNVGDEVFLAVEDEPGRVVRVTEDTAEVMRLRDLSDDEEDAE